MVTFKFAKVGHEPVGHEAEGDEPVGGEPGGREPEGDGRNPEIPEATIQQATNQ